MFRQHEGQKDLRSVVNRLMKNQEGLGNVFGYFYGRQVGQQITEHIRGAIEVLQSVTDVTDLSHAI